MESPGKKKINVMLAGSNMETRLKWVQLLRELETVNIVGWRGSGVETINDYPRLKADLIIVDILLDDITGLETGRYIKEQDEEVKVVVVSGSFNLTFRQFTVDLGMDAYLHEIPDPLFMQLLLNDLVLGKKRYAMSGLLGSDNLL